MLTGGDVSASTFNRSAGTCCSPQAQLSPMRGECRGCNAPRGALPTAHCPRHSPPLPSCPLHMSPLGLQKLPGPYLFPPLPPPPGGMTLPANFTLSGRSSQPLVLVTPPAEQQRKHAAFLQSYRVAEIYSFCFSFGHSVALPKLGKKIMK